MDTLFSTCKTDAVQRWTNAIFSLYPLETSGFLRTQADRFANPVGYTTEQSCAVLYDAVTGAEIDDKEVNAALYALIRIRAVQDFKPSQATGVLQLLKPVLRAIAAEQNIVRAVLDNAEARVDTLTLMAFDLYMEDKETMYLGRVAEIRRRYKTIERWMATQGVDGLIPKDEDFSGNPAGNNQGER